MYETKEIAALFTLIDDPDEEIFSTVSNKLVAYGKDIIPNLENLWENSPDEALQERIEMIIHRLHFSELVCDFKEWKESSYNDLLIGALLVAKFQYPDLQTASVIQEIERIRRNVWLELNSYLTPLEQAHVMSSILYNYYKLRGVELRYDNSDDFLIHKVLQKKVGNCISNGILYLVLGNMLNMNVRAVDFPGRLLLAFFHSDDGLEDITKEKLYGKIHFYVDATDGQPYSNLDVINALHGSSLPMNDEKYCSPINNIRIIQILLQELAQCFTQPELKYKHDELHELILLLD